MNHEHIDYSNVYYKIIAKKPLPPQRGGKFIQIVNEDLGRACLVISPSELSSFHANIVERFCMLNQIGGSYNPRRDHFEVGDPDWVVTGGGEWIVDDEALTARFFGESTKYGRFDRREVYEALRTTGVLAGYRVTID